MRTDEIFFSPVFGPHPVGCRNLDHLNLRPLSFLKENVFKRQEQDGRFASFSILVFL